jgi:hypothetical protein
VVRFADDHGGNEDRSYRVVFHWDEVNGTVEMKLTDIGGTAKPDLIKSLGFNFDQGNTEGETGYTAAYEMKQGTSL